MKKKTKIYQRYVDEKIEKYTIQQGDTLYKVSVKLKLRMEDLFKNNLVDQGGNIEVGMILNLVDSNIVEFDLDVALSTGADRHEILDAISTYYDESLDLICRYNDVENSDSLTGTIVVVPDVESKKNRENASKNRSLEELGESRYRVSVGDNLRTLARRFNIDIKELAVLNLLDERDDIRPGLVLNLTIDDDIYFDLSALAKDHVEEYITYFSTKYKMNINDILQINGATSIEALTGIVKICSDVKAKVQLFRLELANTGAEFEVDGVRPVINRQGQRLYCTVPFTSMALSGSSVDVCCGGWIDYPKAGVIAQDTLMGIWNGDKYREFRKSIVDGSYRFCKEGTCPSFNAKSGVLKPFEELSEQLQKDVAREDGLVEHGPFELNGGFDPSCNLACPTCRQEIFIDKDREDEILGTIKKIENESQSLEEIVISGDGDPFGSPYLKSWLFDFDLAKFPNLKRIKLHTNGLQMTQFNWEKIPREVRDLIAGVEISIDGASPSTYEVNRRGGKFERLLDRLEYISFLRDSRQIQFLKFSFVTQANNYKEIPDFIELGYRYSADAVFFGTLENWGTFTDSEYRTRAVHLNGHPEHIEFLDIVASKKFEDPIVQSAFEGLKPSQIRMLG